MSGSETLPADIAQPEVARFPETAPVSWCESCLLCVNLSLRRGAKHCQGKQNTEKKEKEHELWQESSVSEAAERNYDTVNAGREAERKPPDNLKVGNGRGESGNGQGA